jgi:hypothetical protein
MDRFVVAFRRSASRPLPTPVQLVSEDVPDVGCLIRDTRQPLNHLGHTLQGPQIIQVAVRFGPFGQPNAVLA